MAEKYTAWLWRARSVIGKRGMYTTRHYMDEETARDFFAKEGVTEFFKVEASAVERERLTEQEAGKLHCRNVRPGDGDYPSQIISVPRSELALSNVRSELPEIDSNKND